MSLLSRVPSFSQRPDFPKGLRVMVVDPDAESLQTTTAQLLECNYTVSSCASEEAATIALEKCDGAFDVLLCQTSVVSKQSSALTAFLQKTRDLPLVLMGKNCSQQQKMTGVKLGAVDFLEKPLSELKLRNLWQHTVRKMLRAQKQSSRGKKSGKEGLAESEQTAVTAEPAVPCGVTTRLHRAKQQESTGSSEAVESSADASKDCATDGPTNSVPCGAGARKAESRRKVTPAAAPPPAPATAAPAPAQHAAPPPQAAQQHYYMQGMPAPLPGCVWGLPMLPPPVPGLMGTPTPWAPTLASFPLQAPQAQHARSCAAGVTASSATATSGSQPVLAVQQCWQPAPAPQSATPPVAARSEPQQVPAAVVTIKKEAGAAHTSTTGSHTSHSDATWQALDWGGDDMFFDDPTIAIDPKLDLNNILSSGLDDFDKEDVQGKRAAGGERGDVKGFDLDMEPCETWMDDHSMLEDDFDTSLIGLDYFDGADYTDDIGLSLNKSPSLIDMIDHICAQDVA